MPSVHGLKVARARDRSRKKYPRPTKQEALAGAPGVDQLRLAQQALAQIRESVVITDAELDEPGPKIVYVNEAFTRMTGYRPEEVIGKSPRILQGPKTTRRTLDRLRAQLEKGEAFEGEDVNYRKDGSEFQIKWYIEPIRDKSGKIVYFVAVQRDVTESRRLEAQLLQAQRLEGIGLLASGIAHDLNNVLAPIIMGSDFLHREIVDPETSQLVTMVEEAANRGAGLIKQILSFARGITGAGRTIARDGGGRTILIAGDEVANVEIMREILVSASYKVAIATTTTETLERAEQFRPNLALIDLTMPGVASGSTVGELRRRDPNLPVIAISGLSPNEIKATAPEAYAVLQKPFTLENLLVAVHHALASKASDSS